MSDLLRLAARRIDPYRATAIVDAGWFTLVRRLRARRRRRVAVSLVLTLAAAVGVAFVAIWPSPTPLPSSVHFETVCEPDVVSHRETIPELLPSSVTQPMPVEDTRPRERKKLEQVPVPFSIPAEDRIDQLFANADRARIEHRTGDAIAALREIADSADPRRGTAAFTLGKLLVDSGDPFQGAEAFARARAAGLGILDEDALAREALARAASNERPRAAALGRQYRARYPEGRWLAEMDALAE